MTHTCNPLLHSQRKGVVTDLIRSLLRDGPANSTAELAKRSGYSPRDGRVSKAMFELDKRGWIANDTDGSGSPRRNIEATQAVDLCVKCNTIGEPEAPISCTVNVLHHIIRQEQVEQVRLIPTPNGEGRATVWTSVGRLLKAGLITIEEPSIGQGYPHRDLRPSPNVSTCSECGAILVLDSPGLRVCLIRPV